MEFRKQFRNLVSKTFMPDFDYVNERFSFKTVFHKTPYSYGCCGCAFEHEFLEYISESGDVYEIMYGKIVQGVIDGQCPHVAMSTGDYVTMTGVSGIHIAAATGTEEVFRMFEVARCSIFTEILRLKVHAVIFMKKPNIIFDWSVVLSGFPFARAHFWVPSAKEFKFIVLRTSYDCDTVSVKHMSLLEACVYQNDMKFIEPIHQAFSMDITDWFHAFDISIRQQHLSQLQDFFLEYFKRYELFYVQKALHQCIVSSIMYSHCRILRKILKTISKKENVLSKYEISEPCLLLNRPECKDILLSKGFFQPFKVPNSSKIFKLLNILDQYVDDFQEEITEVLRDIPEVQAGEIRRQLERFVTSKPKGGSRVVKTILELGGLKADWPEIIDNSLFAFILGNLNVYDPTAREILKLLINENPDVSKVSSAVHLGLQQDARLKSRKFMVTDLSETYYTLGMGRNTDYSNAAKPWTSL